MESKIMNEIEKALDVLRKGGIILYPTDTVWGVGCDATDADAVAKVYEIKKRSDSKSLVLLASDMDMICRYVREVPQMAVQLVEVNDKPMTIIYPDAIFSPRPEQGGDGAAQTGKVIKNNHNALAFNTVAEDGSVGIRIPMMDFCVSLVKKFGRPIVSTSANISGEPAPASFSQIKDEIRNAVDYVVDPALEKGSTGKASSIIKIGLDSTVSIIRK